MALLTLAEQLAFAGISTSDPTRDASLQAMIDEAIDAVKRYCNNGELEQTQYTVIQDLPSYPSLVVPYFPVTYAPAASPPIDFQLWVNPDANGDPSRFTSDFLLTMYDDYCLDMGQASITVSQSGIVRFVNGALFANRERPLYSISTKIVPTRGAVKLAYTGGYATVPPAIKGALNLIVRKLYNMRKLGVPMTSESLNSYSYSAQGTATANGIIQGDPTIRQMLATFCRPQVGSYA